MKKAFKNYLKLGVLLFGISLTLVNCQYDDELDVNTKVIVQDSKYTIKTIDRVEINKNKRIVNQLKDVGLNSNPKQNGTSNKVIFNQELNIEINDSYAEYIESIDGEYHSYTFSVIDYNDPDIIKNLVLSLQDDGSYLELLLRYDLTRQELQDYNLYGNTDIERDVTYTVLDKGTFANTIFSKIDGSTANDPTDDCVTYGTSGGSNCSGGGHSWAQRNDCKIYLDLEEGTDPIAPITTVTVDVNCGGGGNDTSPTDTTGDTNPNDTGGSSFPDNNDTVVTKPFCGQTCINELEEIDDEPCEKIKNGTNNAIYKQKFKDLNKNEKFNLEHESGFYMQNIGGQNQYIDGVSNGNTELKIPAGSLNATHVHNNHPKVSPDGTPYDSAIKILSPGDIGNLITKIKNANGPTPENGFVIMISNESIFAISLLETFAQTAEFQNKWRTFQKVYKEKARGFIEDFTTANSRKDALEKMFLFELKKLGLENTIGLFEGTVENETDPNINNYEINWTRKTLKKVFLGYTVKETPCN
ncbi:MAG: hypothetical protein HRT69_02540 [Flavobacteriaceae bacterium]|nr:hypothetical protein [Flavobacteriaceae bacterium]